MSLSINILFNQAVTVIRSKAKIIVPLASGLLYIAGSMWVLAHGNLHEDAYILFQYSKKLASGDGIVFDEISGHAEGATDFLWMVVLAAMKLSGLTLGTCASILNGIGLGLICYAILRIESSANFVPIAAICLMGFSGGTAAALGGFSSLMYAGLIALFFLGLLEKNLFLLMISLVVIPLFRPDGLIIVLGGTSLFFVFSQGRERKAVALFVALAGVFGAVYFVWRYKYFGMPLPLPLMVKAKTDILFEGRGPNFRGLIFYSFLLIPLLINICRKKIERNELKKLATLVAGPFLLFVFLLFAHQSQNIGYRFQFPIVLAIVFIFLLYSKYWTGNLLIYCAFALPGVLFGFFQIKGELKYLTEQNYINNFPQMLRSVGFNSENIAITEAGRFAYWYDSKQMTDLVGLNSADVVKFGPEKVLDERMPNFLHVNHVQQYDTSSFDKSLMFFKMKAEDIKLISGKVGNNPTRIAPRAAMMFAAEHGYSAIFVKYGVRDDYFAHVYFLSSDLDDGKFYAALRKSLEINQSYYGYEQ